MDATKRPYYRELGKRITEFRKRQGYSQAELARVLGVSQQTVFALELGDRRLSLDRVPALLQIFNVTTDQLLGLQPLQPLREVRVRPAELRHIELLRQLTARDARIVKRVTEALHR
jgi:transcriptional regulator with XRE-family HTH domain